MDELDISVSRQFVSGRKLSAADLVEVTRRSLAHTGYPEFSSVELTRGGPTHETQKIKQLALAVDHAAAVGDKLAAVRLWAPPWSVLVEKERGHVDLTAFGPTGDIARKRLGELADVLTEPLALMEPKERAPVVELILHGHKRHITKALYRQTLVDAIDALIAFEPTATARFWTAPRGATDRDPAPLDRAALGKALRDQWQQLERIEGELLGTHLHIFLRLYIPTAWLDLDAYVPAGSGRDEEVLQLLSGHLDLTPIPRKIHRRAGTATYQIKSLKLAKLAAGLRRTEALLQMWAKAKDNASVGSGPDDLAGAFLDDGTLTRELYDHEQPRGPMEVLEALDTRAAFYQRLEEEPHGIRSVDYSIRGAQEREFNLRVNVVDGLMTAWTNTSLVDLAALMVPILDKVDAKLTDGRPGVSKVDETPFLNKAFKSATALMGFLPKAALGLGALTSLAAVASSIVFATPRVELTHPVEDGSVFEIPRPGHVEVRWRVHSPWWRSRSPADDVPAAVEVFHDGVLIPDQSGTRPPGWPFAPETAGLYRVDIKVEGSATEVLMIRVKDF